MPLTEVQNYYKTHCKLVRKDMDVNEHERLSNITLRHTLKVKEQLSYINICNVCLIIFSVL